MSMAQVEDFRQHGYVVMDGLLTKETAARIKSEASKLTQKGALQLPAPQPAQSCCGGSFGTNVQHECERVLCQLAQPRTLVCLC
jgi:hypothetical protein